jgi:hypothetical protein
MLKNIPFEEKELAILRSAVDIAERNTKQEVINSPIISKIISIVEKFLKTHDSICYGGTAINNILPDNLKFYDKSVELPDYDFYSPNALDSAKLLADIYTQHGFIDVEAKSGVHHGTYKVFVNYIPVADITQMDNELFSSIKSKAILVKGILYAPPNFLRMAMYLELSRPKGDVSRWEKVQKRLVLLNKQYPIKFSLCNYKGFQRTVTNKYKHLESNIYTIIRDLYVKNGVVFFGGYAISLFSSYMPKHSKTKSKVPDFDVLYEDPLKLAKELKTSLESNGYDNVVIQEHTGVGEIVSTHYEILIDTETVSFIYKPLACHSYNVINTIKIATIDTMLSFYLAFLYIDRPYYDVDRIACMAQYLYKVQDHNRLKQKGLLKRFSIQCYGRQETLSSMREEKSEQYKKLHKSKNTKEYEEWFLRYVPTKTTKKTNKKVVKSNKKTNKKVVKSNKKTNKKVVKSNKKTIKINKKSNNDLLEYFR